MNFGIYHGGIAGTDTGMATGPAEDAEAVLQALDELQGERLEFAVRAYVGFNGDPSAVESGAASPSQVLERYAANGRKLDLVLCCGDERGDAESWTAFVRNAVRRYGPWLGSLQIGEEPNLYHFPGDGRFFPQIVPNLIAGVLAARQEADDLGHPIRIGVNSVPCFDPNDKFWTAFAAAVSPEFLEALDYVALDFFPDVFRRLEQAELAPAIRGVLEHFRAAVLPKAGIEHSVPLHIGENGWPTAPDRSYERQAEVIETVIRTIHGVSMDLNITQYEHFALRDADSSNTDFFHQFGLLRDDYGRKPAFEVYRQLIRELGD
jgi:hypothetical protein